MIPQEKATQQIGTRAQYVRWLSIGVIGIVAFTAVFYRLEQQSGVHSDAAFFDTKQLSPDTVPFDNPRVLPQVQTTGAQPALTLGTPSADPLFDSMSDITYRIIDVRIHGATSTTYAVQVADTDPARTLGLSNRTFLVEGTGLLFVFEEDGYYPFWMKDMNFPIDIIWINEQKQIVHIAHSVDPDTYPLTVVSQESARYVLEIPAGDTYRYGFEKGTRIDF
jgi:uncharacterized membrane protein (UPF0127 family)